MSYIVFDEMMPVHAVIKQFNQELASADQIVLAIGDSFVSGSGLGDYIVPGWQEPHDWADMVARKKWNDRMEEISTELWDQVHVISKKLCFSGVLSTMLPTAAIINDGKTGCSNGRTFRRANDWIIQLRSLYPEKPITIIAVLTEIDRFEAWLKSNDIPQGTPHEGWSSIQPAYDFDHPRIGSRPGASDYRNIWLNYLDNVEYTFYKTASMIALTDALSYKYNVRLVTRHWLSENQRREILNTKIPETTTNIINTISPLWFNEGMTNDDNSRLICGHYTHTVHEALARSLNDTLFPLVNDNININININIM